jgi:uncharacterized protein (TIGR03437 family)
MTRKATILSILFAAVCSNPARGQAPASTLKVELKNVVEYQVDTSDISKYGINPNITKGGITSSGAAPCFGVPAVALGDIVSVNGQPAQGTYVSGALNVCLSPTPNPSQPVADTTRNSIRYETYEILQTDGTPVGTIMTEGLNAGGPSPPGPPAGSQNFAIVGGTGAFLGARGQTGNAMQGLGSSAIPIRLASVTEDPANRRLNGGGHVAFTLYVIPLSQPAIATTASGPAVTHSSDFSLVSASKPAAAGEILSLFATGLGPTVPGVAPGTPFPSSPLAVVNSPVVVTVNGKPADVLGAVGYPGAVDGYQVNFRVPPDTAKGAAAIQVSAAWIASGTVSIQVQ